MAYYYKELIAGLVAKYAEHEALDDNETAVLEEWRDASEANRLTLELLREKPWLDDDGQDPDPVSSKEFWDALNKHMAKSKPVDPGTEPFYRPWAKWLGIIVVFAIIAVSGLKLYNNTVNKGSFAGETAAVSGTNNTGRTLLCGADGSMIAIDTMARGSQVRLSDSSFIRKIDKHSYQLCGLVIGRMVMPRSLKVGIDLKFVNLLYPDESRVTLELNATYSWSSFRNPAHPDTMEGKARFDIAKNNQSPWTIHLPDSSLIEDLATRFEIDASIGEAPKVSLVRGAVMVRASRRSVELHTKEQAIIKNGEPIVSPLAVDTALWIWAKEPLAFDFKNTSLDQTVHIIANYYRVVVSNPNHVQGIHVTAKIPASKGLDFICKRITEIQCTTAYLRMSADSIYITDRKR
jgi:hypothetical protein